MERGEIGGLNYKMPILALNNPQVQGGGQPQYQPQGYEVPMDNLDGPRQDVMDLYEEYGLLKSIISDLESKGIQYDRPDYSQPGGGLEHQAFLAADANVRYAAQKLANQRKLREQANAAQMRGDIMYSPNYNPEEDMLDQNSYINTQLMPGVEQTNRNLSQETNTPQDQARANQLIQQEVSRIDNLVRTGYMTPEAGEYQKAQLVENRWKTQMFSPNRWSTGNGNQQDYLNRAELIKQVKRGIVSSDQTPLNVLKLVPGVEDIRYINTGDRVGLQVYYKGQPQPSFIDLSQGKGEGDINAMLNRIEGQKNVPNEVVFQLDTKVDIPQSNARQVLDDVKAKVTGFPDASELIEPVLPQLKQLAASQSLMMQDGSVVSSIDTNNTWWGPNELIVEYYPADMRGNVDYSKTKKKKLTDPAEIDNFLEINANEIAPAYGGGFVQQSAQPNPRQQQAVDAFVKQFGRQPSESELQKIKAKYN